MKQIGGNIRGGNLALILSGIFFIFLGITTTFSTGTGTSNLTILGFGLPSILLIIVGFVFIILALRANAARAVVKSGS